MTPAPMLAAPSCQPMTRGVASRPTRSGVRLVSRGNMGPDPRPRITRPTTAPGAEGASQNRALPATAETQPTRIQILGASTALVMPTNSREPLSEAQ